ncbi:hypothetical protein [Altererythrobacter sp. MF3-039]|uniref:hypothetical protein n=1 Tax=Altererythrobacter sp. MF3-039 TaxID=3252901 RepID=UPI00390CA1BF
MKFFVVIIVGAILTGAVSLVLSSSTEVALLAAVEFSAIYLLATGLCQIGKRFGWFQLKVSPIAIGLVAFAIVTFVSLSTGSMP